MKRKKLFIAVLSLTLMLPAVLAIQAQAAELKFGHVGAPGSLFTISVDEFAKRVNAEVDGYKVVAFGSSQLGKDRELLRKLKLGSVDFCLPSTVMSSVVDESLANVICMLLPWNWSTRARSIRYHGDASV